LARKQGVGFAMAQERKAAGFVHLRVKSAYSLLEGAVRPEELARLARDSAMPAAAVTDVNNLFGVYEISETLAKKGVQPVVGCLLSVDLDETALPVPGIARTKPPALPLLVQNDEGYRNLTRLLSAAYLGAEPGDWPHVAAELLSKHTDGLIALTGGPGGPVNRLLVEGQDEAASQLLDRLHAMFGDRLYVELQRHGLAEERATEDRLLSLAYDKALPLVATNDVHFGLPEMYEAHDAVLCIADGTPNSPTCRKRSPTRSRSRNVVPSGRRSAIPSCRNSFRSPASRRPRSCARRLRRGSRAGWRCTDGMQRNRFIATGSPSSST
jgi:DNA polymerase III subunit alpha